MITLHALVEKLIAQNPELMSNPKHLLLEVWDRQGLRLYPHQRDVFLAADTAAAEAVTRASRRVRRKRDLLAKQASGSTQA